MAGLPVTIRLLDPPLHEFLPHATPSSPSWPNRSASASSTLKRRAGELHEFNPMLGHRGCRLGITFPEIYEMQAAPSSRRPAMSRLLAMPSPVPEVMIPLVATRGTGDPEGAGRPDRAEVFAEKGRTLEYLVGTMIELPRAALMAGEIAEGRKFFSFGTNDLTQTTLGVSAATMPARFLGPYVEQGIFPRDPFVSLDIEGVGQLVRAGR
jgi:pyruvate,orthophosphate dikinase